MNRQTFTQGKHSAPKEEDKTGRPVNHDSPTAGVGLPLACTLTPPGFRLRKATTIQQLKKQVKDKIELENGFTYLFADKGGMAGELTAFIQQEKQCCPFFQFILEALPDQQLIQLTITGPEGVKPFILSELEF